MLDSVITQYGFLDYFEKYYRGKILINPYAAGGQVGQYKIMQKFLKNHQDSGKWVLI